MEKKDNNNYSSEGQTTVDKVQITETKIQVDVHHPPTAKDEKTDDERRKSLSVESSASEKIVWWVSRRPQIIAALGSNMGAFVYGQTLLWSAAAVPALKMDPQFDQVTPSQYAWVVSILTLGALSICLPSGILVDWIGRRRVMIIFSILYIGGYLLIYFAWNVSMIIGGRFIAGVCCGVFVFVSPIFIAETSDPDIRGALLSSYGYMACLGELFQLSMGGYLSWQHQSLFCAVMGLLIPFTLWFVPESPRFLLSKGKLDEALKSLTWLSPGRSQKENEIQLEEMNIKIQEERERSLKSPNPLKPFFKPEIRSAMGIGVMLLLLRTMTGIVAIFFYRIEIFQSAQVNFDEYTSSVIVCAADLVSAIVSASITERFGRKTLMIGSEIILAAALGILGGFFHVKNLDPVFTKTYLGWLPLTTLLIYAFAFAIGMTCVPSMVSTEILPQSVRGTASSLLIIVRWSSMFFIAHFFKDMIDIVGPDGCYWFFASCCLTGAVYIHYFVPETRGKSLEEIQSHFLEKTKTST